MSFLQTLICWVRLKDNTAKLKKYKPMNIKINCAGCLTNKQCINNFSKHAKWGNRTFGFCSEDCYNKWLRNPKLQHLNYTV